MIVDCHTHISSAAGDVTSSEHLEAAETVDTCIVLADAEGQAQDANEKLSQYVSKHREKMIGFAVVEPTKNNINIKKLASIPEKLGLKGAVLYCSEHGFHPAHSKAMQFYESAQELGLPVFFHNGQPLGTEAVLDYAQPYLLGEVARTFPHLRVVIGNMGIPFVEQTLSMVANYEHVYADLTVRPGSVWQIYNMVVGAYEYGVMKKLLFGSGFPLGKAEQCIEILLGFNKLLADTNLPTVPRDNIRSIVERDALELLGIAN